MRRRGQLASQAFIYILGIIVVGLLLLLGLRAIDTINKNKCDVQRTQFVTELASAMENNKKWGTNKIVDFTMPCDAQRVCFVSRQVVDNTPDVSTLSSLADSSGNEYETIASSINDGVDVNVFLQTGKGYEPVERFQTPAPISFPQSGPQILCLDGEPLRVRFIGQGQTVEVRNG